MSWKQGTADNFTDLLVQLDAFLALGHGLQPVYTGTGNGRITGLIGTSSSVQETLTVTFSSATAFSVAGSVTGAMGSGTVGTAFAHARAAFTITAGSTAWVAGDTIQVVMTLPWQRKRLHGGAAHLQSQTFDVSKVVDGSAATYTNPLATDLPQWGGLRLLQAVEVRSVRIGIFTAPTLGPRDYRVEYSDDGQAWTMAAAWTAQTWTIANELRVHDIPASGAHLYWRMVVAAANGANADIAELIFYTGTGGQTSNAIPWFGDAIWQAPGNAGTDQIYLGAQLHWNAVGAYWCWRLGGFTGYSAGAAFASQPGYSGGRSYMTLWDAPIPYWFIASGKSVKVIAKVTSQYEQAYMGFLDAYSSPGGYPYPLLVGGSMGFVGSDPVSTSTSYRYAVNTDDHKAWWSPGGDANSGSTRGTVSFRAISGAWRAVNGNCNVSSSNLPFFWPYCNRSRMGDLRLNLDGNVPLFPILLTEPDNTYGEPEGVMALSGNNQSVENLISVGRRDWLVVQNISRVGVLDYVAYRLT